MQGDRKSGVPSPEEVQLLMGRVTSTYFGSVCAAGGDVCVCFGVVTAENYVLPKLLKKLEIECL